jgi:hypothetical protein
MENVIVLRASRLESMGNVIVLPCSKRLATTTNEKTVDVHVFIAITGSISLIRHRHGVVDKYVYITITGAISLLVDY